MEAPSSLTLQAKSPDSDSAPPFQPTRWHDDRGVIIS